MSIKHRIAILLTVTLLLAACGGGDDLPATAPEEAEEGAEPGDEGVETELVTLDRIGRADAPNTMTLQITQGHSHQSSTESHATGFAELYQGWAEENPDWRIDVEVVPAADVTTNQAVLLEQARVGRAPDCAEVDSFVIAQFIGQGYLQPITEYFTQEEIDGFYPFISDVVVGDDGELYAFWWNTDLRVLYYRTDLIPEAPQTWDELLQAAAAATEQDANVDGYLFNGGRWEATVFDNLAHFWSQGGELVDDEGRPIFGEGQNREYMITMLEFLQEAVESGASPQRVATITEYDEFNTAAQAEAVASFQGGHWQHDQLQEILSEEQFASWDFTLLPGPTEGARSTGTGGWTIAAFTEDPEIAATCMDFARSVYMGPANELTTQLPTSPEVFEDLEAFDAPQFEEFAEYLEVGQARPGVPLYPEISELLQVGIGQMLTGERTPEQVVDEAYEQALASYESRR